MKALLCSIIIFCSVVLATVAVAIKANSLLTNFSTRAEESISLNESAPDNDSIETVFREYQKLKRFMTLFIREDDIRETEMYLEDIKSAAKANDQEALMTSKSRLMLHIEQLRRLSVFSFEAIL